MSQTQIRRSMADALQTPKLPSPEALAIIQAGAPKPTSPLVAPITEPAAQKKVNELPTVESKSHSTTEATKPTKPKTERTALPDAVSLVSVAFRLPPEIPLALLQASADRKMKRIRPFTQQDIVTEALTNWLKKNGYLE